MLKVEVNVPELNEFYASLIWHPFEVLSDLDGRFTKNFRHILNRTAGMVEVPSLLHASLRAVSANLYVWEQMWKIVLTVNNNDTFIERMKTIAEENKVPLKFSKIKNVDVGLAWSLGGNYNWLESYVQAMDSLRKGGVITGTSIMSELTDAVDRSIVQLRKITETVKPLQVYGFNEQIVGFYSTNTELFETYTRLLDRGMVVLNNPEESKSAE